MKLGKFTVDFMEHLISKIEIKDERVHLGAKVGEDAALLDYGDTVLVAKTDPITFASDFIGWYSVQINANDVACAGAIPKWYLATLLVPQTFTEKDAEEIFDQILKACASLEVTLVGGHSEVTQHVSKPIVVGCMLGEAIKGKTVLTGDAMDGDSIVLTKGIAIEGTSILARDAQEALANAGVNSDIVERAQRLLFYPGISVVRDAITACSVVNVNSMHDPTEGGLATGLWELARAAGAGLAVDMGSIPILPECKQICEGLKLDPLGLMASGALLLTLPPEEVPKLMSSLEREGVETFEIGRITGPEEGVHLISSHGLEPMPKFGRDELARFFSF